MSYQALGHILLPIYVGFCALAILLNFSTRNAWLAFGYLVFDLLLFQFLFDGKAPEYGFRWYFLVSGLHIFIISMALIFSDRFYQYIVAVSIGAIILNAAYFTGYLTEPLPRHGYFVGMNLVQSIQIVLLIAASPIWAYLKSKLRHPRTKEDSWMLREITPD